MRELAALRTSSLEKNVLLHGQSMYKGIKHELGFGGLTTQMEYHAERTFLNTLANGMDDPTWVEKGIRTMEFPPEVMREVDMSPPSSRVRNLPPAR